MYRIPAAQIQLRCMVMVKSKTTKSRFEALEGLQWTILKLILSMYLCEAHVLIEMGSARLLAKVMSLSEIT